VGVPIAVDRDLVTVRAVARAAAAAVGLGAPQQTRFATAVSELARTSLAARGGGALEVAITADHGVRRLEATVADRGGRGGPPGPDDDAGPAVARRLADHFTADATAAGGLRVTVGMDLSAAPSHDAATLAAWRGALAEVVGRSDLDHLRDRNVEMTAMLDRLNAEMERAEAAMAEAAAARRAAEEASGYKAAFLAHLSHEIRTPLHAILGFARLLEDTTLSEEQRELLEPIRTSGLHLRSLIDDTLDLSKIEAGRLELEARPLDVRRCVQEALDLVAVQAAARRIELVAAVGAEVPGAVVGDETRVRQILVNYLSNAVKFSQGREVVVTVTASPPGAEVGAPVELCVSVRDHGVGIPPEAQDRLFQAFTQADPATTRTFGGTGLGLSINRSLAELMGGRVWFESEPGVGSTFSATMVLPVAAPRPVSATAPAAAPAAPPAAAVAAGAGEQPPVGDPARAPAAGTDRPRGAADAPLPRLRVLLVDDSEPSQDIGRRMLTSLGIRCAVAVNGREAVSAVHGQPFDVVLMDLDMPVMNGFAATRAIRDLGAAVRQPWIVAVTANAIHGERDRCLAAGMNDYLAKPVDRDRLRAALRDVPVQ
jgi:signal transduction histidine kinase/CheY-like chemotaxis protein